MIKGLAWWLQECLICVNTFTLQDCSKTETLDPSSNHTSRSQQSPKYLGYEADLFFQNVQNFLWIAKM